MDSMILETQKWLNTTYGTDSRYKPVDETGKTGWQTIYALTRALQIELEIQNTADSFGPNTQKLFIKKWPFGIKQQNDSDKTKSNIYAIIQGALWCKGYSTGSHITKNFYNGTGKAVKSLKTDMGLGGDSTVTVEIMKALLSMQQFVLLTYNGGNYSIRSIQQEINRKYKNYTGIIPTDGLYGREMNKAMIKVLQSIEGYSPNNATGNFGSGTISKLKNITSQNAASNGIWVWIGRVMLLCNGYEIQIHTGWNSELEIFIKEFQKEYCIPETNSFDINTWMSLFVSTGNPNRKAYACDTRCEITDDFANKLKIDGYKIIGRYITGGNFKELRDGELQRIIKYGFSYFPIFQDNGRYPENFTFESGISNAKSASKAAIEKGIPKGSIIYFAVDFDAYNYQVDKNIIPYFKGINEAIDMRYKVGIYASRNICTIVSNMGYSVSSFVSDMSTGYSGNLGFSIPKNWNLDQFCEITGYGGKWDLDKVSYKNRFPVCNSVESDMSEYQPYTLPSAYSSEELFRISDISNIYDLIKDIELAYIDYKKSNYVLPHAVLYSDPIGALQFIAKSYYHDKSKLGILKDVGFSIVSKIQYDEIFEYYLEKEKNSIYQSALKYITGEGTLLKDKQGGVIDLPHLAITTLSYCNSPINPPSWNGWAGDLVSAYELVQSYHYVNNDETLTKISRAYIGGVHPEKDLIHLPSSTKNSCNYSDLCSDGYAILLAKMIKEKNILADAFKSLFEDKAGTEFKALLNDIGVSDEIPLIRNAVTKVVKNIVTNLLSILENNFKDSDEDVKESCINAFSYWLHFNQ